MTEFAVRAEGLGKRYRIGTAAERHDTLGRTLLHAAAAPFRNLRRLRDLTRGRADDESEVWALRDVTFDVRHGEVLGVIGRNGAGKSTLLRVLSRITEPTEGRALVRGRVGSLLEVGTGFHPELTGRENVYLSGSILGMDKRHIDRSFDEIVAFAGVSRFIDTPVKRYSSGMYLRLAFAVAAHLEPEILIVDEVLAVGDMEFQRKCLGKMSQVAREGRTVLFVSHNMQAISGLTERCLILDGGRIVADTTPSEAIATYLRDGAPHERIYTDAPSPSEPRIVRAEVRTSEGGGVQAHGAPMEIEIDIHCPEPIDGARLLVKTLDNMRQQMFYLWTYDSERPMCRSAGVHTIVCRLPKVRLYMGDYTLLLTLLERYGGRRLQDLSGICPFRVEMLGMVREGGWHPGQGVYVEDATWSITGPAEDTRASAPAEAEERARHPGAMLGGRR